MHVPRDAEERCVNRNGDMKRAALQTGGNGHTTIILPSSLFKRFRFSFCLRMTPKRVIEKKRISRHKSRAYRCKRSKRIPKAEAPTTACASKDNEDQEKEQLARQERAFKRPVSTAYTERLKEKLKGTNGDNTCTLIWDGERRCGGRGR